MPLAMRERFSVWSSRLKSTLGLDSVRSGSECEFALPLLLFDILEDCIQIVIEACGVSIADSPHFIDNWIVHGSGSNSSSGVQMMGR